MNIAGGQATRLISHHVNAKVNGNAGKKGNESMSRKGK